MFIGGPKGEVIKNIETAFNTKNFNVKVEVNDPMLSEKRKEFVIKRFLFIKKSPAYIFNNWISRSVMDTVSRKINKNTVFKGLENIPNLKTGAIITSNHFNPLENTAVRVAMKKAGHKRMYVVCQESNMAMKGFIGYLMNYIDTIPIWATSRKYMTKTFEEKLEELEKLVKQLESDNVPLKEAVDLYTQANKLLKECNTELNDTKATIQKISEDGILEEF